MDGEPQPTQNPSSGGGANPGWAWADLSVHICTRKSECWGASSFSLAIPLQKIATYLTVPTWNGWRKGGGKTTTQLSS